VSRVIAFFDFDGTITSKDTLLEFIKYSKGEWGFYSGFALHAPVLIAYKLKLITNQRAKEIMMGYYFGKMPLEDFNALCEKFNSEIIPTLIRKKALKEINQFKAAGAEVVIVSASPENWITHWCRSLGVKLIATRMAVANNKLTGRINGLNCHGEEKVRRIQEMFDVSSFSSVYCYGDTPGDKPMLALGNFRFYKPFR
jgi:phosphatidylglycerophosphatase C